MWLRSFLVTLSAFAPGRRTFPGYKIYSENEIGIDDFSEACRNALIALVRCDDAISEWTRALYHGILPIEVDVDSVCDAGCARAILDWQLAVDTYCGDSKWADGAPAGVMGSFILYGIKETCQTDKKTGKNCNDVIPKFSDADTIEKMLDNELYSPFPSESPKPVFCLSDVKHIAQPGDTCDSLAVKYSVSLAAIFYGNPDILDCNDMVQGVLICLPL
ncbi:hypothetical protein NCS52_00594900 [Fusarium sp. LHS14.1]|nr:hypothetical protein NCS52_00594900 [Fusarium sp. LHS14.1]